MANVQIERVKRLQSRCKASFARGDTLVDEVEIELLLSMCRVVLGQSEETDEVPRYVKLGGTALRHTGDWNYYRDAGRWSVKAGWTDGRLFVLSSRDNMNHLHGAELVPCTCEEWAKDNEGYV
jgi:hypothetical protein